MSFSLSKWGSNSVQRPSLSCFAFILFGLSSHPNFFSPPSIINKNLHVYDLKHWYEMLRGEEKEKSPSLSSSKLQTLLLKKKKWKQKKLRGIRQSENGLEIKDVIFQDLSSSCPSSTATNLVMWLPCLAPRCLKTMLTVTCMAYWDPPCSDPRLFLQSFTCSSLPCTSVSRNTNWHFPTHTLSSVFIQNLCWCCSLLLTPTLTSSG